MNNCSKQMCFTLNYRSKINNYTLLICLPNYNLGNNTIIAFFRLYHGTLLTRKIENIGLTLICI